MKAMPTDDDCFGAGSHPRRWPQDPPGLPVRGEGPGRESKGAWDYYKLLQTTPTDEAFRPLAEGGCPLVRS